MQFRKAQKQKKSTKIEENTEKEESERRKKLEMHEGKSGVAQQHSTGNCTGQ